MFLVTKYAARARSSTAAPSPRGVRSALTKIFASKTTVSMINGVSGPVAVLELQHPRWLFGASLMCEETGSQEKRLAIPNFPPLPQSGRERHLICLFNALVYQTIVS